MKRLFASLALLLLANAITPNPRLSAADNSASSSWSGSYRGRVLTERFLHRQAQSRPTAALNEAHAQLQTFDVGHIAVINASGGVVAQPNFLDLQGASVGFAPDGSSYLGEGRPLRFDDVARTHGVPLALGDDDFQRITLPFAFSFFGSNYSEVFVNSDGSLTFGEGDAATSSRSVSRATAGPPRIAPLYLDLNPAAVSANVRAYVRSDRIVFTWDGVPAFGGSRRQIFQAVLFADGAIGFHYLSVNVTSAVVGIFPGGSLGEPIPANLSGSFVVGPEGAAELFQLTAALDPMTATRRFYANHGDAYDFIFLFNNFGLSPGPGTFAFELNVRNDIIGIGDVLVGQETFDFGDEFGSPQRLSSFLNMGSLTAYPDDPTAVIPLIGENSTLSVMGQEAGHRWGVYTEFLDPVTNQISDALLGRGDAHWNFFFDSNGSVMEGNDIVDAGTGVSPRFRTGPAVVRYGDFDQYIMGLLPPEEVVASFLVEQPQGAGNTSSGRSPQSGVSFDGIRKDIPLDAVIAAEGSRQPSHQTAPRKFNFAFVLLTNEGAPPPSASDIAKLDRIRREWTAFFEVATDGRADANSELHQALRLSVWPSASIIAGRTAYATVAIDKPLDRDLTIGVGSDGTSVFVPSTIKIPAGQTSTVLMITGATPGTSTIRASAYPSGPDVFDTPSAAIEVLAPASGLAFAVLSGDNQPGAQGASLAEPVVVRVTDEFRNPLIGGNLLLTPTGDGTAKVTSREAGTYTIDWTLSSTAGPNQLSIRVAGMPTAATVTAEYAGGVPSFSSAGVVNAASFEPGSITPGSVATVFGLDLAPGTAYANAFPLPRTLAGVQVFIGGVPVPLYFVSPDQINFQVPVGLASGTLAVTVSSTAGSGTATDIVVARVQPGIFFDSTSELGAMRFPADGSTSADRAARNGEFVELFGVGLGEVNSQPELGEPASGFFVSETVGTATVTIGEQVLPVTFSGLAPGFAGLYQVNFQLPSGLLPGRYELRLTVDGIVSNRVFIDIE